MTTIERTMARAIEDQARQTGRLARRRAIRRMVRRALTRGFLTGAGLTALAAVLATAWAIGLRSCLW